MRYSILSTTVFIFLLVCQVCFASTSSEPQTNMMMMFPRDAPAVAAGAGSANATAQGTIQPRKARAPLIWASPEILQNGTLFYIALSISTLLWCTGKGIDMTLDQQERRAEYMARR